VDGSGSVSCQSADFGISSVWLVGWLVGWLVCQSLIWWRWGKSTGGNGSLYKDHKIIRRSE